MAKQHGLGRGLSSLIPPKKSDDSTASSAQATVSLERVSAEAEDTRSLSEKKSIYTKQTTPVSTASLTQSPQVKNDDPHTQHLAVIGVSIGDVVPNTQQPRLYFDDKGLRELADSINEHGVLQPLIVLKKGEKYELIAGERRLRASKMAGLTKVPVIVRGAMKEQKKLELAIIENVQRHDLNVIEEAKSYAKLADEFDLSQEDIAQRTGKSRSAVANKMRLIQLPIEIQRSLMDGALTEGHAKVILSLENTEKQRALYHMIMAQDLSVRDAERVAKSTKHVVGRTDDQEDDHKMPKEHILEEQLTAYFGTKVQVKTKKNGAGDITIKYFSQDELRTILAKLKF